MAIKIENKGARSVGVNTPGGIRTVRPGKSAEFDEIINLEAIKGLATVKVSGDESEKKAADDDKSKTSTGGKPAQGGQTTAPADKGTKAS